MLVSIGTHVGFSYNRMWTNRHPANRAASLIYLSSVFPPLSMRGRACPGFDPGLHSRSGQLANVTYFMVIYTQPTCAWSCRWTRSFQPIMSTAVQCCHLAAAGSATAIVPEITQK